MEATPELLPLSGSPDLVVLGREVALGPGKADLLAIEMTGRPVIIEVKLARNSEARRSTWSRKFSPMPAFLQGVTPEALDRQVRSRHLHLAGHRTVRDAVSAEDQRGAFDPDVFDAGLRDGLRTGRFRLVLVLDDAPRSR